MQKCQVLFKTQYGQTIVLNLTVEDTGDLVYSHSFDPPINDPKTDLGLAGYLCEEFLKYLAMSTKQIDQNNNNNESED